MPKNTAAHSQSQATFAPERRTIAHRIVQVGLALGAAATLASCAGGPSVQTNLIDETTTGGISRPAEFECSRVTGQMQVRILQIRGYTPAKQTSGLSRGLQGLAAGVFGGSQSGLDPDAQYHKDVAQLREQNKQLAANGCKTFNLDAELQNTDVGHTPTAR